MPKVIRVGSGAEVLGVGAGGSSGLSVHPAVTRRDTTAAHASTPLDALTDSSFTALIT